MNPTAATHSRRPAAMADVARRPVRPAPVPQPLTAPIHAASAAVNPTPQPIPAPGVTISAPQAAAGDTLTSIVNNIPMHAPAPVAALVNEDDELETIMKDVGHELKQADRKTTKKHVSLFGRKHQAPAVKPAPAPQPAAVAAVPTPQPTLQTQPVKSAAAVPKPAVKPPKDTSTPVGVIFITLLVAGALIAAAIYSYK